MLAFLQGLIMRNVTLQLALLGAFGLNGQAYALGLEPLSANPSSSAYISCYNNGRSGGDPKGNFGSYLPITAPSATANNTCAVVGLTNDLASPKTGYVHVTSVTRVIPTSTGGGGNIGSVIERIWRKQAATSPATATDMCIFGAKITMLNADHDSVTQGIQYFQVNDLARGGFSTAGTTSVGYFVQASTASPVFRIGRTFTSVQHRAFKYDSSANKSLNGTNYLDLPTNNTNTAAITGENSPINATTAASTTLATQDALNNSNWIDFTLEVGWQDDDGNIGAVSPMTYAEGPCNSDTAATINAVGSAWRKSGALRLRQTAQEDSFFKEIEIEGFAPPGVTVP